MNGPENFEQHKLAEAGKVEAIEQGEDIEEERNMGSQILENPPDGNYWHALEKFMQWVRSL